jgi:CDP-diacylglycerol---glycerol-3-phosphate 3-phosphatidyltransferase
VTGGRAGGGPFALRNLPNTISILRILLVPVLVLLLRSPSRTAAAGAAATFFLASWSDFFDGYLARRHGLTSTLGKLLDPLADKILVLGTMVFLVALNRLPGWMVVVVMSRELAVTSLRGVAGADGVVIAASKLGKYKTVFQDFALGFVMLYYPVHGANVYAVGMVFMMAAVGLTIWSGIDYFWAFRKPLKG